MMKGAENRRSSSLLIIYESHVVERGKYMVLEVTHILRVICFKVRKIYGPQIRLTDLKWGLGLGIRVGD